MRVIPSFHILLEYNRTISIIVLERFINSSKNYVRVRYARKEKKAEYCFWERRPTNDYSFWILFLLNEFTIHPDSRFRVQELYISGFHKTKYFIEELFPV